MIAIPDDFAGTDIIQIITIPGDDPGPPSQCSQMICMGRLNYVGRSDRKVASKAGTVDAALATANFAGSTGNGGQQPRNNRLRCRNGRFISLSADYAYTVIIKTLLTVLQSK